MGNLSETNLRYIVFLIDSKLKDHDGKVFTSYTDTKEFASDVVNDNYADKAIIGMFYLDQNAQSMQITLIETIGFKGDKKDVLQLQLFK